MSQQSDELERAFVAMSHLVGRRGDELLEPLPQAGAAAQKLAARLGHPERSVRAQVLAAELAPIVRSLEDWRYR